MYNHCVGYQHSLKWEIGFENCGLQGKDAVSCEAIEVVINNVRIRVMV